MDECESSDDDGVVCIYCLTRPLDDSNQRKWYQCPEGHLLCGTCREPVISCDGCLENVQLIPAPAGYHFPTMSCDVWKYFGQYSQPSIGGNG